MATFLDCVQNQTVELTMQLTSTSKTNEFKSVEQKTLGCELQKGGNHFRRLKSSEKFKKSADFLNISFQGQVIAGLLDTETGCIPCTFRQGCVLL